MQSAIVFISSGANSAFGGFARGDRARVSAEMAKHFVDVGVAIYAEKQKPGIVPEIEPIVPESVPNPIPADAPKRKGKK